MVKYKEDYQKQFKKRRKHVPFEPKQGFLATAVRQFYTDLSKVKHDDLNLVKALKFVKICSEKYLANGFVEVEESSKKNFREIGGASLRSLR